MSSLRGSNHSFLKSPGHTSAKIFLLALLVFIFTFGFKGRAFPRDKAQTKLDLVEAKVVSVLPHSPTGGWLVILAAKEFIERKGEDVVGKVLVIGVGQSEGTAILLAIHKKSAVRPLTHELFANTLKQSGTDLSRCLIHTMTENTFFARLDFVSHGQKFALDCRPSDGIALALRLGSKIFVTRKIYEAVSMRWPPEEGGMPQQMPREEPL